MLALAFSGFALAQQGPHAVAKQSQAYQEEKRVADDGRKKKVASESGVFGFDAPVGKSNKPNIDDAESEKARRDKDPAWVAASAARDSAYYALIMNWITGAGVGVGFFTLLAAAYAAVYARKAAEEAGRAANAGIASHEAFVSAEDANLFVEFLRSEIPSEVKDDQPTGGVHNLGLRIKNIGRSTAHIEGWEIPGKTHRQEHTLAPGENWDRMKAIPFASKSGNIIQASILYTSPIRRRMKLHMQGMLLTKQDRHGRWWVSVKILATDLRPATD